MILDISSIDRLFTWQEYLDYSGSLFIKNNRTTSESETYNSQEILDYTKLNFARIKRVGKQLNLSDGIKKTINKLPVQWRWIMLVESWCGDVAQVGPVIAEIAASTDLIEFSIVLRDRNIDLMDQFLTNGGRAIPKLICLNPDTNQVIGSWGPRPQILQEVMNGWAHEELTLMQKAERMHKWYADDHTINTQLELNTLLNEWIEASIALAYTPVDSHS